MFPDKPRLYRALFAFAVKCCLNVILPLDHRYFLSYSLSFSSGIMHVDLSTTARCSQVTEGLR